MNWKCLFKHNWEVWKSEISLKGLLLLFSICAISLMGFFSQDNPNGVLSIASLIIFFGASVYFLIVFFNDPVSDRYTTPFKGLLQYQDKTCLRCNKTKLNYTNNKKRREKQLHEANNLRSKAISCYQQQIAAVNSED